LDHVISALIHGWASFATAHRAALAEVMSMVPALSRTLEYGAHAGIEHLFMIPRWLMGHSAGDLIFRAGTLWIFGKSLHEAITIPKIPVDVDEIAFEESSWPYHNPKRYLKILPFTSTLNLLCWYAVARIIAFRGIGWAGMYELYKFLILWVGLQFDARLFFKGNVVGIHQPAQLLKLYQGKLPLLEGSPEDLKIKAIGYNFTFRGWRFRQELALWLSEPYFLRWVGLIFPFGVYIVPVQNNWRSLKDRVKSWLVGFLPKKSLAPVKVSVRPFSFLFSAS